MNRDDEGDRARRRAQAEPLRQPERAERGLTLGHVGVWDLDLVDHTATRTIEHDAVFGHAELLPSWTYEDFIGYVLPEDRPDVERSFGDALALHRDWDFECRIRRIDGEVRWIWAKGEHQADEGGEPRRMFGIVQDITDRKQAEDALRRSQLLLVSAIESQKDTILFAFDSEYRYLFFNKAHRDVMKFAYGTDIHVGDCILDMITDDEDRVVAKENYDRALSGESHTNVRVYGDVNRAYYESFFNPIIDDEGVIVGATGLARDITARQSAEEDLRRSRDMLVNLTDQVPGVVYQYVLHPDGTSAFPFSSRGMNDIYEYAPEDVREDATPVFGRLHPDDSDYVATAIQESARTLEPFHCEFRVVLPRQGLRWRLSDALPQRTEDGGTLWYGIISDITERKEAENEIRRLNADLEDRVQARTHELRESNTSLAAVNAELTRSNAELEEATRAKSDFLASMSHELRTPLNSIIGFSGVLLQGISGSLDEEQRRQVAMINNSGRHLLGLINGVLDLARVESGQADPVLGPTDVGKVAREMFESLRPQAEAKGIEMRWACPEDTRPVVTDGLRVGQILLNLMGNAIRFTESGHVSTTVAQDEAGLRVIVEDTGCGIEPCDLERIFDDFVQVVAHRDANSGGTGLGLAVSRRLADSLGAEIEVMSEPGRGSTFTLHLPARPPEEEHAKASQPGPSSS